MIVAPRWALALSDYVRAYLSLSEVHDAILISDVLQQTNLLQTTRVKIKVLWTFVHIYLHHKEIFHLKLTIKKHIKAEKTCLSSVTENNKFNKYSQSTRNV